MRISDWSSDVCSSDLREIPSSSAARFLLPLKRSSVSRIKTSSTLPTACRMVDAAGAPTTTFCELASMSSSECWKFETFSRSEEHTSELQSLMRISYAVFCLKKTKQLQY